MNITESTITSNNNSDPSKINKKKVKEIFKKSGFVLLRNFHFNQNSFFRFTKSYTKTFSTDANRREKTKKKVLVI